MACIRRRRGRLVVDYRDATGRRRWKTCRTRREADAVLAAKLQESRQPLRPVVDPDIRVLEYQEHWLGSLRARLKSRTIESYKAALRLHLLPAIGSLKVRLIHKGQVKALLTQKLATGLSRGTVRIIHATLRAMLNAAVDDGVISANPSDRLGRYLRLSPSAAARQEEIKAITREQVIALLGAASRPQASAHDRRHYALFLLLARTGMRIGEAFGLQWQDIDFQTRQIRVQRAIANGRIDTPKSGHGRTVDMSEQLADALRHLQLERKVETLRRGWPEVPAWVFCSTAGTPLQKNNVRRIFVRLLKSARLPLHFSLHCLRHTYASLLIQQGESPAYVQRQLGHASIKLTVDTYGKWLPMGNKAAVDRLDDPSGSKVVAKSTTIGDGVLEVPMKNGEPWWDRTTDPLIKSQVLCQLS